MFVPDQTSPCAPVRVLVVDDTEVSRQVLAEVVGATPGFEVVGDAASGREAIELIGPLDVQFLLLDVEMPDLDGIETAMRIRRRFPGVVILLLTAAEGASLRVSSLTVEDKRILSPGWLADFWGRHSHSRSDSGA
jgi:DNA-binding NarL/FixJ family response regulator